MTFAEAVDQPEHFCLHTAAANYKQSETRDITEDRLRACANAGLTQYEVAKGFGATQQVRCECCGKQMQTHDSYYMSSKKIVCFKCLVSRSSHLPMVASVN